MQRPPHNQPCRTYSKYSMSNLKKDWQENWDVLGEDQFGFKSGKGYKYAIRMLRITSEWTLAVDDELCACFIDWQKACDCINWIKLMQVLKWTGIEWCNRRFISKLYMDQSGKLRQEVWRLEEELNSDCSKWNQRDAVQQVFYCTLVGSTCFGCQRHPSSGAQYVQNRSIGTMCCNSISII